MVPEDSCQYQRRSEPTDTVYRSRIWQVAFGLQDTDGLAPSGYMRALADDNVYGRKSLAEVANELHHYYDAAHPRKRDGLREEEADKVSLRIVELLEDGAFSLDPMMLDVIHEHLFKDIDDEIYLPGAFKQESLVKCEEVLNGDSVLYGSPRLCERSLDMLFAREFDHQYAPGSKLGEADMRNLSRFIANIWMVHPFAEGNTRTIAVFTELYLRLMGFDVDNEPFAKHARYFRCSLVRACYQNRSIGVSLDTSYLESFISRLLGVRTVTMDYDSLWCLPLFAHPDKVRNVSMADAAPVQRRLIDRGVTTLLLERA